jgi:hypothetical protein
MIGMVGLHSRTAHGALGLHLPSCQAQHQHQEAQGNKIFDPFHILKIKTTKPTQV